jgi:ABC-type multidrug transport system ATPase subunit
MPPPPSQQRPASSLLPLRPRPVGKSTLLDILAARKTVGRLTGAVSVNGAPRGSDFVRMISYVPQEDNFMPAMTVAETCRLHAALKLPRDTPAEQAATRIDDVLCSMGMLHARDTLVGGELPGGLLLRGLSGGERRRLSVAVGILASPSIVFLDGGRGRGTWCARAWLRPAAACPARPACSLQRAPPDARRS